MKTHNQLISMREVCARTSLSRTAINKHRLAGNFPKAVAISDARMAFVDSEIDEWIAQRIAARS